MRDIRDDLFRSIYGRRFRAALTAERAGVLAGTEAAKAQADELGIELELCKADGEDLMHGERIGTLVAAAKQVALAEERMIGALAKASGIATAARTAVLMADGRAEIVSGSWKKMPPQIKELIRGAILTGGANCRIAEQPMIYLDKNYIRMLGSIPQALAACASFHEYTKVVQLRGESATVAWETQAAVRGGADVRTGGYGLSGTHKSGICRQCKADGYSGAVGAGRHPLHWERNCRCPAAGLEAGCDGGGVLKHGIEPAGKNGALGQ